MHLYIYVVNFFKFFQKNRPTSATFCLRYRILECLLSYKATIPLKFNPLKSEIMLNLQHTYRLQNLASTEWMKPIFVGSLDQDFGCVRRKQ